MEPGSGLKQKKRANLMTTIVNNQNIQGQDWKAIAHQLAHAIKVLEEDSSSMKNWHRVFWTLDRYEEMAKKDETISRDKFGKFTLSTQQS